MRNTPSWRAGPPGAFLLHLVPSRLSLQPRLSFEPGTGCSAPWHLDVELGQRLPALGLPGALQRPDPSLSPTQTIKLLLLRTQGPQRVRELCDHGCPRQSRQVGSEAAAMQRKKS